MSVCEVVDDDEVEEAEPCGYGLDYVVLDEEIDASPVLCRVPQRMGHLLVELLPRRLQHGLLMRLLSMARLIIGDVNEGKWTEYRAARSSGSCTGP